MKKKSDPVPMGNVLSSWLKTSGLDGNWSRYKVFSAWNLIVNEELAEATEPQKFYRGVLEVAVTSPPQLFELQNFHKDKLIKKLREQCPDTHIEDIKFICIGKS